MSHIYDLIKELASKGVQFEPLGNVGTFIRGNGLQKSNLTETGFPAIHYGQIHTYYGTWTEQTKSFTDPALAAKLRRAKPGDLILATTSEDDGAVAKATAWVGDGEVAVSGDAYIYRHTLDPRYVAYFFQSQQFQEQKIRHITGTKVRRVSGEALAKIRIPVPPVEVQREIVRVLDLFGGLMADLATQLDAEIKVRQRQSAHYRDAVLAFENWAEVNWVALGDVATVRYGRDFPASLQGRTIGEVPFFKVSDMTRAGNGVILATAGNYVDASEVDALRGDLAPAGTVLFPRIGAAVATNKKRLVMRPSAFDTSFMGLVPGPEVHPEFLLQWMATVDLRTLSNSGGAVPSVRRALLEALPFPLIPFPEQERIAADLDKFDALTSDLAATLPAERNARRKQYEYYRDCLLTFKELAA